MIGILQNSNLNNEKIKDILDWHYKKVDTLLHNFKVKLPYSRNLNQLERDLGKTDIKKIITATPDELMSLVKELPHDILKKYTVKSTKDHIFCHLYSTYRKKYGGELVRKLEITVCPYCNRNFISSDGEKSPVQFDHFYNKSKYPIFALSFFNLIPCCSVCNHWKATKDFQISPYDKNYKTDDIIQFSYFPVDVGDYEIEIEALDSKMTNNIETLQLKQCYSTHINLLRELVAKKKFFFNQTNRKFWKELERQNNMPNDMTVEEFLYGNYLSQEKYYLRPLSKFTHDIVNELERHKTD